VLVASLSYFLKFGIFCFLQLCAPAAVPDTFPRHLKLLLTSLIAPDRRSKFHILVYRTRNLDRLSGTLDTSLLASQVRYLLTLCPCVNFTYLFAYLLMTMLDELIPVRGGELVAPSYELMSHF